MGRVLSLYIGCTHVDVVVNQYHIVFCIVPPLFSCSPSFAIREAKCGKRTIAPGCVCVCVCLWLMLESVKILLSRVFFRTMFYVNRMVRKALSTRISMGVMDGRAIKYARNSKRSSNSKWLKCIKR